MDVSDKVLLAAFEAALVESGMRNLDYGDRDSVGVFQQRPSQGWGSASDCMKVPYASRQFCTRAQEAEKDDPKLSAGELAQVVQRSAYPDRYGKVEDRARALVEYAKKTCATEATRARDDRAPDWAERSEGRFTQTLEYMYDELRTNQNAPLTWAIWMLNKPWAPDVDPADIAARLFDGATWTKWLELLDDAADRPSAFVLFGVMVAPGMPWDHKPKIQRMFDLNSNNSDELYFKIPDDSAGREVFYDIWSNMHYGYVGRAAGFDEGPLHAAPQLPGTGEHDPGDVITMQAGMDLWDEHGDEMTVGQFSAKVYATIDELDAATPNLDQVRKWTKP